MGHTYTVEALIPADPLEPWASPSWRVVYEGEDVDAAYGAMARGRDDGFKALRFTWRPS